MSESADPEDTDRMLRAYFALAREEIERHGGTVEKFIGDAVVGVFGAPVTHEDDPERAVRAAIRIADLAAGLTTAAGSPLRLRIGINTGETLVHVGAQASAGEAVVVGDAINTASRIQSVAPEGGVAVGAGTWESTHLAIEYAELPPAVLKGKQQPVRVFHALRVLPSLGVDLSRSHSGTYVGRQAELGRLVATIADASAASRPAFLAIVGEAGIGKSRILAELAARVRTDRPNLVWRQGRCLPYGEGVTFWALGEIVKAHAGILEGDDATTATANLDHVLTGSFDHDWVRGHLLALLGSGDGIEATRDERFAAWRSFLASLAADGPAVIVFDDVHWADEALIAFLVQLAEHPPDLPLVVILTARPSLDERHPGFAPGLPGLVRVDLHPLSDDETGLMITGLLGTIVPDELRGPIVERAEGNPLYAEEFVRLLADRDLLVREDGMYRVRDGAVIPMPDSIAALIGARLDALPPSRKALLADAAVVGKVFWAGAVATMGDREPAVVRADLDALAAIELVRLAPASSMAGESEFAFWHVLARDVAYGQLPRSERAARHHAAGDWLQAKAGDRATEVGELLAHHYATALELARTANDVDRAVSVEPSARRWLWAAGRRALGLDTTAATSLLERALELAPAGHPDRPGLLVDVAHAADHAGRLTVAQSALEEAIEAFEARGDERAAARARLQLHLVYFQLRDPRMDATVRDALAYLLSVEPSMDLVLALTQQGVETTATTDFRRAVALFDRAIAIADQLGVPTPGRTLRRRGNARLQVGEKEGMDDLARAIELARAAGDAREAGVASIWYGGSVAGDIGCGRGYEALADGLRYARTRGVAVRELSAALATLCVDAGRLDETVAAADEALSLARASAAGGIVAEALTARLVVAMLRGELDDVRGCLEELTSIDPWYGVDDLWIDAQTAMLEADLLLDRRGAAARRLERILGVENVKLTGYSYLIGRLVRVAAALGGVDLDEMTAGISAWSAAVAPARRWAQGTSAASRGDLAAAAEAFGEAAAGFGALEMGTWAAMARLDEGRALAARGRREEAQAAISSARASFEQMGATAYVSACDAAIAPQ
jgi:tetratricopeptide (TPR) repeat protein